MADTADPHGIKMVKMGRKGRTFAGSSRLDLVSGRVLGYHDAIAALAACEFLFWIFPTD
jgi:hypothetical protein